MNYLVDDNIRGLIFDFDGTLVDSMPVHFLSWKEAFASYGQSFSEEFFYDNAGVSLKGVVGTYNRQFGTSLNPGDVVTMKDQCHLKHLSETKIIEPIFDIVKKYFGKLPMAVATGNSKNLTLPLIESLGMEKYFQGLVFGDEVTHSKPHPECFLTAAKLINVPPEYCEVFEDGEPGLEGAQKAGMKATDIRPWLLTQLLTHTT